MRHLAYILSQTGRNLSKTWGTQIMTLLTVTLSVLIFSFFFLIYTNMLTAGDRLGDDVRLILYLEDEIVPELQVQYEEKIRKFSEVEKIIFVSRQEAFSRLKDQLGKDKDVLEDLGSAFLPPSIEVYPKKTLSSFTHITQFSDYLTTLPGASKVQYGHDWVQRFGYFTNLIRIVVLLSGGLLVLTTTFIVSYTIRMTIATREAELEILRLLGATGTYIRCPLLIEGLLQGLLGCGLGLFSLYMLFRWISMRFSGPGLLNLFQFSFFPAQVTTAILLVGITLCTVGSLMSMRKFLRI